jgi:enoyl-CoA hydratase
MIAEDAYSNLSVSLEGGLAVIAVNRPKALNALNSETIDQLLGAFTEIEKNPVCRVVIITGTGEKAFIAGADIRELKDCDESSGRQASLRGQRLFRMFENSRLVVIAAVNGFALGGGMELAMACDFRIASENAVFGLPEVGLSIIPGFGGTQRLPRLVGRGMAMEMIATARKIKAPEALTIGLVNRIVPQLELLNVCREIANSILQQGPLAVSAAKRCLNKGIETTLDEGQDLEAHEFGLLCRTHDRTEGMVAFIEKRPPNFQGN